MQALAKKLGINEKVRFLGSRNDIPRLLKASDCFILSSRREGLPGVVLEAVASGIPVVATDLPGVREIAKYTQLISIVPVENPQAIYLKTREFLNNLKFYKNNRADFPDIFNIEVCAQKLYEVYCEQTSPKAF
jgi:glycosyltransferase involved in cell wall biosynthesis